MNATKRKFNTLLSSIGSRPQPNTKEANGTLGSDLVSLKNSKFQSKKRRVSNPASERCQSSLDSRSISSLNQQRPSESAIEPVSSPPKYAPWDRNEFLKRLKSFSNILDWTPKPARVNEVQWAKRGWVCQKSERVRCCLCSVEIVVKLNRKDVDGKEEPVYVAHIIEDALVDKYVELIVQSHEQSCLWRKRGCDDSIFTLPLNHPPTTIINLKERYEELKASGDYLPYMHNLRTPPEFNIEKVLRQLPENFFPPGSSERLKPITNSDKVAFSMALFGWQGYKHERFGAQLHSASCNACFRVLGLWIFKSKEMSDGGEEVRGATMNCLDLVAEHRAYCPWKNSASQSRDQYEELSPDALPGWKIVLQTLKSEFILRNLNNPTILSQVKDDDAQEVGTQGEAKDTNEKDKEFRTRLKRVRSLFDPNTMKRNFKNVVRVRDNHSRYSTSDLSQR
ncbi:hypothetical protein K3495_g8275 [Podosphaera aphanis]|nr:hypothetical protein K3495_g8275 [Podosphaera aphanis]